MNPDKRDTEKNPYNLPKESHRVNLHNLPKDMLVKLLMTIEGETIKKYEEELANKKLNTLDCFHCSSTYFMIHNWKFHGSYPICEKCQHLYSNLYSYEKYIDALKKEVHYDSEYFDRTTTRNLFLKDKNGKFEKLQKN